MTYSFSRMQTCSRRSLLKLGLGGLVALSGSVGFATYALAQTPLPVTGLALSSEQRDRLAELGYDPVEFLAFVAELKNAFSLAELSMVRSLSTDPMDLRPGGRFIPLSTLKQFEECRRYLFSAEVVSTILDEDGSKLFINADGVAFNDGMIWISQICIDTACSQRRFGLRTINLPDAS